MRAWLLLLAVFATIACGARGGGPQGGGPRGGDAHDPADAWALAPGQAARVAHILGVGAGEPLPDGCRLLGSVIEERLVRARYACDSMSAPFEVQLRHVSTTHQNTVRGARVAVVRVDPAGGPDRLVNALLRREASADGALQWRPSAARAAAPDAGTARPDVATADRPTRGAAVSARPHTASGPAPPAPSAAPARGGALAERSGGVTEVGIGGWWYSAPPFAAPGGYGALGGSDPARILVAWCTDGVVVTLLIALGLAWVLRRQLRECPRSVRLALLAITLAGVIARLAISRDAPMNAFAFQRVLPLASQVIHGPVVSLLSLALGRAIYLTSVISWTNFALACITPLALFAHARFLLRDDRAALAAAALVALLPMHIRFSRSDVQFIASLLSSSLTFIALYGALTERSLRAARPFLVALPLLSLATYLSRPENIIFAALDGGAILLYANRDVPRGRSRLVVALVLGAAALSVFTNLLAHFSHNVRDGLSLRTLENALRVVKDPQRNTLINPAMTPPGLWLLVLVGTGRLWLRRERRRVLFLLAWLGAFFVVHSYVFAEPMMMARYHLHLVTPLILLAAAGVPWLWERAPRLLLGVGLYALAWPVLHLPFERDVQFSEMHELAFLRAQRGRIAGRCTVLEFVPATAPSVPELLEASRVGRAASAVVDGNLGATFSFRRLALFPPGRRYGAGDAESITPEARALLRAPPPCLYLYEGLTCRTHVPTGARVAPACAEALAMVRAEAVARVTFPARRYDDPNAGRFIEGEGGALHSHTAVPEGEPITLTLWRVTGAR